MSTLTVIAILLVIAALVLAMNYRSLAGSWAAPPRQTPVILHESRPVPTGPPQTLTTPPFRWTREQSLPEEQKGRLAGTVSLDWTLPGADQPWRGSQETRNLAGAETFVPPVPLVSFDHPTAAMMRQVNVASLRSASSAAGLQEAAGGFARTTGDPQMTSYRDLVSVDSLGVPNPRLMAPHLTGR